MLGRIGQIILLAVMALSPALSAESLIGNGNFETARDGADAPDGFKAGNGVSFPSEDGNRFLRLVATEPGKTVMLYRLVDLKPDHKALELSYRVRYTDIKPGKQQWFDGRIMMNFKDADDKVVKPSPGAPNFKGTKPWAERSQQLLVPEGATKLELMFTLFQTNGGTLDFDDISLTPIDPKPVIEAREAAARARAEDIARRAAAVKPKVEKPEVFPPMLKVQGNQIVNAATGESVWLQGVAVPSMTWNAGGENVLESIEVACRDWKSNIIRLGVREHFWAGVGPYQKDGGAAYRQLIDDAINLAASHGAYTVINLHRFRAPEQKDADFWREVATKYKDHPSVLFELFNEPHDISWEIWRDGGRVTDKKRDTDAATENNDELRGFESVGMQGLLDVVRATGAKNIVIAGGLDWSYDLSGVLNGYALDDRGGHGIVYSTHVYSWKSNWQKKFLDVAEKHPLFLGECGAQPERMPFIPQEQHEPAETWVPDFLGMVQKHKLHWTGWSFHPKASPCLLSSWDNFTPTPYWGEPAKRALAGEQFEMKRMR